MMVTNYSQAEVVEDDVENVMTMMMKKEKKKRRIGETVVWN